jgi:hypothetical protein
MVRWTLALVFSACTGDIGDARELDPFEPPTPPIVECTPDTIDRTPEPMRRLEASELAGAIEALLGVPLAEVSAIPAEPLDEHAQYARAAAFSVTENHVLAYRAVAEAAAARFVADEAVRVRLLTCDPAAPGCLERFARDVGLRAFRRPLVEAEVADLVALGESLALAGQPFASFSAVLEAVLQAPSFIHLVEDGVADVAEPGAHVPLDDYEIATRLSLALFGAPPDAPLLARAERGELADRESLRAVALEMLADERAATGLTRFASEWLKLDEVTSADRADDRFADARGAMRVEMERLVVDSFFDARSVEALLLGSSGYADPALAAVYGVSLAGTELASFERPADRHGLLGSAGWLASTSNRHSTAAARRGKYVRDLILCDPPPPPPPGVPMTEPMEGESASDLEARHLADPACSTCHRRLDPIGWGLERYGPIGELRTLDETGEPVRDDGFVAVGDADRSFSGATALAETVLETGQVERCVAQHVATYALARSLESAEARCFVDELERSLETHGSVRDMLVDLVTSDAFTHRTIPPGDGPPGDGPLGGEP